MRKKRTTEEERQSPGKNTAKKHERKSVILTETGLLFPEKIVFYIENIRGRSRPFDPAPSASMFSE